MLIDDLGRYVALRYSLGFKFRTQRYLLLRFVEFAAARGDRFITSDRVLAWAVEAPSPEQRRNRLLTIRRFAIAMHAEDPRHEVPAADALGRGLFKRKLHHIYQAEEIQRLMNAAAALPPAGTIRPRTFVMLIGLLAATGMRISEALTLRVGDLTEDGLTVNMTKFKKSRLLPLHPSTRTALEEYLSIRSRFATTNDAILISNTGAAVSYDTAAGVFRKLSRQIGLRAGRGQPGPRIHDLRHSFAVRSLEACAFDRESVSRHILALSTYLGHAHVTDTYWYLQATPTLMAQIGAAGEALQCRGVA
jgi:integrase